MGGRVASVHNVGAPEEEIVHLGFADGRHAVLQCFAHLSSGIEFSFYGERAAAHVTETDAFRQFKNALAAFVGMLRTGRAPFDFSETVHRCKVVIAALESSQKGLPVKLDKP